MIFVSQSDNKFVYLMVVYIYSSLNLQNTAVNHFVSHYLYFILFYFIVLYQCTTDKECGLYLYIIILVFFLLNITVRMLSTEYFNTFTFYIILPLSSLLKEYRARTYKTRLEIYILLLSTFSTDSSNVIFTLCKVITAI